MSILGFRKSFSHFAIIMPICEGYVGSCPFLSAYSKCVHRVKILAVFTFFPHINKLNVYLAHVAHIIDIA